MSTHRVVAENDANFPILYGAEGPHDRRPHRHHEHDDHDLVDQPHTHEFSVLEQTGIRLWWLHLTTPNKIASAVSLGMFVISTLAVLVVLGFSTSLCTAPHRQRANEDLPFSVSHCDVAFAILTAPEYYNTRIPHVAESWLRRLCNMQPNGHDKPNFVLVASGAPHPKLPTFAPACEESYHNLCCKTAASIRHMVATMPDKKWFMKLDDDTLVAPYNLARELSALDWREPWLVGGPLFFTLVNNSVKWQPFSRVAGHSNTNTWEKHPLVHKGVRGGAGYVLSQKLASMLAADPQRYLDICQNTKDKTFFTLEDTSMSEFVRQVTGGDYSRIVQLEGMSFHKPQVGFRRDFLRQNIRPVAFHMMHKTEDMALFDYLMSGPLLDEYNQQLGNVLAAGEQPQQRDSPNSHALVPQKIALPPHPCQDLLTVLRGQLLDYYTPLFKGVREVAFIGLPDHSNRGDSAIFVGALHLLDLLHVRVVDAIHLQKNYNKDDLLSRFTVPKEHRAIVFHGGGNFGDLYRHHHLLRFLVLEDFPTYDVIMFPQTVNFKTPQSRDETTVKFTSHKARVYLAARDEDSLKEMLQMFPKERADQPGGVHVVMLPDMAFMLGDQRHRRNGRAIPNNIYPPPADRTVGKGQHDPSPQVDMLIHARTDGEAPSISINGEVKHMSKISEHDIAVLLQQMRSRFEDENTGDTISRPPTGDPEWYRFIRVTVDDWLKIDAPFAADAGWRERMEARTFDGMRFLARARVVVTNRLHGHILMLLLGIEHVMLGDRFGKLEHYRRTWTHTCRLSHWETDFERAMEKAVSIL